MGFVSDFVSKLLKKQVKDNVVGLGKKVVSSVVGVELGSDSSAGGELPKLELELGRFSAKEKTDTHQPKDEWGPFEALSKNPTFESFEEFWYQMHRIEDAASQGDRAFSSALSARGIHNSLQLKNIRDTFNRHFGQIREFQQAVFSARERQGRELFQQAVSKYPALFAPVDGVDLKTFATIQARMMQSGSAGPDVVKNILAAYDLTQEKWVEVNRQWLLRMTDQTDPTATVALNGEYGRYFAEVRGAQGSV